MLLGAVAAGALLLSGCGSDAHGGAGGEGHGMVEVADGCEVEVSADMGAKPEVTVPDCAPPAELVVVDVVEGDGPEAGAGDAVAVQYAGFSWSTGAQFDASWDRGAQAFTVEPLGQAGVIAGWNEGLMGASVGDRRLLVIPPDKGYGAAGAGGVIAPGETLVFVVDVVSVNGES
jgi:peptidylprolyl isomerase